MNAELIAAQVQRERKCIHQPPKVLRALLGFGIGESNLAEQLGVTVQMVSQWKRGERGIAEHWQGELYAILGEFLDSREATIRLLKQKGRWDRKMRQILNTRFREAQKVYDARPQQYRDVA